MKYSVQVEKLAVLIIIPSSIIWAAAQIQAFGHILSIATNIESHIALIVATFIVIAYTSLGGMLADIVNDVIQGGILILGLCVLLVVSVNELGGLSAAAKLLSANSEKLNFYSNDESFLAQLDNWMIPIFGSLIAQEMISRILSTRNANVARRATLNASILYFLIGMIPVILGLLGAHLISSELPHNEQFLPTLAQKILPSGLFVLFVGAIIAAILSTIDSSLLSVSAFVTNNLFSERFSKMNDKSQLIFARVILLIAGTSAYIIATSGESVYSLVEMASSFGAPGVLVITFAALWKKTCHVKPAIITLMVGVIAKPVLEYGLNFEAPFLGAIVLTTITYFAGTFTLERRH